MSPDAQQEPLVDLELESASNPVTNEFVDRVGRLFSSRGLSGALHRYLHCIAALGVEAPAVWLYRIRNAVVHGDLKMLLALLPAVKEAAAKGPGLEIGLATVLLEVNRSFDISDMLESRLQRDEPLSLCEAQLLAGMAAKPDCHRMLRAPFKHAARRLHRTDKSPGVASLLHLAIALLHVSTEPAHARLHLERCGTGDFLESDLAAHAAIAALRLGLVPIAAQMAADRRRPFTVSPVLRRIHKTIAILDDDAPSAEDNVQVHSALACALLAAPKTGRANRETQWLVVNPLGDVDRLSLAKDTTDPPPNAIGTVSVLTEGDIGAATGILLGAELMFPHYIVFKPSGRACVFQAAADGVDIWPWEARPCRLNGDPPKAIAGGGAPLMSRVMKELGNQRIQERSP